MMTDPTYEPDTPLSAAEFAQVERFGLDKPNPVVEAINEARAAIARGEVRSITIDPDDFRPLDELDRAEIIQFFAEEG